MSGKTGTTEAHRSSAFVGFTQFYAAANYVYDRLDDAVRTCAHSRFGNAAPATSSAAMSRLGPEFTAMKRSPNSFGDVKLPPTDPRYVDGGPGSKVPSVSGMNRTQHANA